MGIEDRDWFREKKLNYDYDDSFGANKFNRRNNKAPRRPSLRCLLVSVFIIFLSLGMRVFSLLLPKPHQVVIQQQNSPQNLPSPSDAPNPSPPLPPQSIQPPASPIASAQGQPESTVTASSAESQTLHYYKKNYAGMKYLTLEINDIPLEVVLDTGASNVALSSAAVQKLGISRFTKKTTNSTAGGPVDAYLFECDSVKLGTMMIKNVTCDYVPTLSSNLLGNSFLSNFIYSINEGEETITLIPKNNKTYISNNRIMPAEGSGWAEINGKKYRYDDGRLKEIQDK